MSASLADVREIALALPGTIEAPDGHRGGTSWRTKNGVFVWERGPSGRDLAQLAEQGRVWPSGPVVGVRTGDLWEKEAVLETFPGVFFTIPHFDGWPSVLVRLDEIDPVHLREVVIESWLLKAPKRAAAAWLAEHPEPDRDVGGGS